MDAVRISLIFPSDSSPVQVTVARIPVAGDYVSWNKVTYRVRNVLLDLNPVGHLAAATVGLEYADGVGEASSGANAPVTRNTEPR